MLNTYPVQAVKSEFSHLSATEVLESPIVVLNNVSDPIAEVLKSLNIQTVFELAVSRVFNAAHAIVQAANQPESAIASLGTVPAEYVTNTARKRPIRELQASSIELLDGIGPQRFNNLLAAAPELQTIRDLALWEPFQAARQLLNLAFGDNGALADDPDAPAELLPTAGEYATEKVYYSSIFLDEIDAETDLKDIDGQVDLLALYNNPGFTKPATGAILTFEQAWFPQGLSLGQLLHSIALAPAESTRIAIIDWSRQTSAAVSESISQAEALSNSLVQNRAISETVEAVATEAQNGFSSVSSQNQSKTGGGGFGLSLGGLTLGGSGGASSNRSQTTTVSSSRGRRSITGETLQDINQSTQQNATSVRTRRASVVREVSQSEQERLQTRIITNYNHSHALSIHYYEVVQIYRVVTCLAKVERCIFIPMKPLDFDDARLIDRYRSLLYDGAHSATVRDLLLSSQADVVVFRQQLEPYRRLTLTNNQSDTVGEGGRWTQRSRSRLVKLQLLSNGQSRVTKLKIYLRDSERPLEFPADHSTLLIKPAIRPLAENIQEITIDYRGLLRRTSTAPASGSTSPQNSTIPRNTISSEGSGDSTKNEFADNGENGSGDSGDSGSAPTEFSRADHLSIRFDFAEEYPGPEQTSFTANFKLHSAGGSNEVLLDTVPVPGDRTLSILLNEEASYYSQLIWRNLDAQSVALLLSRYTFRGKRLVEYIDPQPLTVYGNYLVLRYNFDDDILPDAFPPSEKEQTEKEAVKISLKKAVAQPASSKRGDHPVNPSREEDELQQWQAWKDKHIDFNQKIQQEIPIGTGGTFAEAVLGRYNASEKLDITRFWDWQTSPIPQQAPEIAPLTAGSRGTTENLTPGQLDAPVVNIMNPPNLPDPQGLAGALNALTTANLFRDMSGLSGALQLAQQGITSASDSAVASGAQAGQNLQVAADLQKAQLDAATKILTGGLAGLPSSGGGSGGNISHTGALLNHGAKLDQTNRAPGSGVNPIPGSGGGTNGPGGNGSGGALPGSGGSGGPASYEADAFQNALNPLYGAVDAVSPILAGNGSFVDTTIGFGWGGEDEAEVRAFRPNQQDKSAIIELRAEVHNPPAGARYQWHEPSSKDSIQHLQIYQATKPIAIILGKTSGLTKLDFTVSSDRGNPLASTKLELSIPQFFRVTESKKSEFPGLPGGDNKDTYFIGFFKHWSLTDRRKDFLERVKTDAETLLRTCNVRLIWNIEPFNENGPRLDYNSVVFYNKLESIRNSKGIYGFTYVENRNGTIDRTVDEPIYTFIAPGEFDSAVDHEINQVVRKLHSHPELNSRSDLKDFAIKVLARLTASTLAHEVVHSLLGDILGAPGEGHTTLPGDIMRDGKELSFRDLTGIEVTDRDNFPEPGSYNDLGVLDITLLNETNQKIMDKYFPVPPAFK